MQTKNFQMSNLHLEKGRGTRDQIANIRWIIRESQEIPEKHLPLFH